MGLNVDGDDGWCEMMWGDEALMKKVMGRLFYGGMKMRRGVEYGVMVVCEKMVGRVRCGCVFERGSSCV